MFNILSMDSKSENGNIFWYLEAEELKCKI